MAWMESSKARGPFFSLIFGVRSNGTLTFHVEWKSENERDVMIVQEFCYHICQPSHDAACNRARHHSPLPIFPSSRPARHRHGMHGPMVDRPKIEASKRKRHYYEHLHGKHGVEGGNWQGTDGRRKPSSMQQRRA